tara:strand:- start:2734 stop:3366 length:633 start_codon:yes stop_codon:yes gene_type:complete
MKLITEFNENITITEGAKKELYIEGIFLQGDIKNQNGRKYPVEVLDKEVRRYTKEYVDKGRALGELGHPAGPVINLDRTSHLITELFREGNNFQGKAKVMGTPYGNIVKNLIKEGANLGVSSRGMGSVKKVNGIDEVQKDFVLATVDIVADPSAPDAFVNGIMEGKEWVWENGVIKERIIQDYKQVISKTNRNYLDKTKIKVFEDFMSKL